MKWVLYLYKFYLKILQKCVYCVIASVCNDRGLLCAFVAFGRLLNHDYVTFMRVLIAAQANSHPDLKVGRSHRGQ